MTSLRSISAMSSSSCHLTPEAPRQNDCSFSAIINLVTSASRTSPVPAQCESTRLRCSRFDILWRDADRCEFSEAGIEAIDRIIAGSGPRDQLRRRFDWCTGGGIEANRSLATVNGFERLQRQSCGPDVQGRHSTSPKMRSTSGLNPIR